MAKMLKPYKMLEITPNLTTAWLLNHIVYCSRYAKVEWHGKTWFASSHEEFAAATGLTKSQVKRSFASLREAGLIETEQHIYGGKTVTHVRTTLTNGQPGEDAGGLPGEDADGLLPIQEEDQIEDQPQGAAAGTEDQMSKPSGMKGWAGNVSDIVQANNEKAETRFSEEGLLEAMEAARKSPNGPRLEKVFQIAWVKGGFGFRPPLIPKEQKQLRDLCKACADTEVGIFTIVETVSKWELLAAYLKTHMKKSEPPPKPNIGYILASKVTVLQWITKQANEQANANVCASEDEGWDNW